MSLIPDLKSRVTAKAPSPAEIKTELTLAEAALADLEARHGGAALDAMSGTSGADATLRDLEQKLTTQRQRVQTLRAAHTAAVRREEEAIQAQRASLQRTQYRAMKKHLDMRDAAAKAFGEAVEVAAANYKALLEHSSKAIAACPVGKQFPMGAKAEDTTIKTLIENELYRISAKAGPNDPYQLPGAVAPSATFLHQPENIQKLVDAIKEGSTFAANVLKVE
jgi:hypothetical protein